MEMSEIQEGYEAQLSLALERANAHSAPDIIDTRSLSLSLSLSPHTQTQQEYDSSVPT